VYTVACNMSYGRKSSSMHGFLSMDFYASSECKMGRCWQAWRCQKINPGYCSGGLLVWHNFTGCHFSPLIWKCNFTLLFETVLTIAENSAPHVNLKIVKRNLWLCLHGQYFIRYIRLSNFISWPSWITF